MEVFFILRREEPRQYLIRLWRWRFWRSQEASEKRISTNIWRTLRHWISGSRWYRTKGQCRQFQKKRKYFLQNWLLQMSTHYHYKKDIFKLIFLPWPFRKSKNRRRRGSILCSGKTSRNWQGGNMMNNIDLTISIYLQKDLVGQMDLN